MAQLPIEVVDPIATAIFAHYEKKFGGEPSRPYLGASSIGESCSRKLWYSFHWAKPASFPGRVYRLFQTGHLEEPRIVSDLRGIGCKVFDVNPETGQQWSFKEDSAGDHFAGNCDGILTGLPTAPKAPHILEVKTSSDKAFKTLQKNGVEKDKPLHYAQMQIYMHWSIKEYGAAHGCKRALYIVKNKDNDDLYTERIEYDSVKAQSLVDKAIAIIKSTEPPQGISTDPSWFECKFCDYSGMCFKQEVPEVTCRSCVHSTPEFSGGAVWSCEKHGKELSVPEQRAGCNRHLYIPILLKNCAKAVDGTDDTVTYEMSNGARFVNGNPDDFGGNMASTEIHACADKAILTDVLIVELRKELNAKVVG